MVPRRPPTELAIGRARDVSPEIRLASIADAEEITALVNAAFQVESFFKRGDRTDLREVTAMFETGTFLVARDETIERAPLVACAYLECRDARAYFGMLSIAPASQRRGLGRRMIDALETRARAAGCRGMTIHVVNLRRELPPLYRRFGYVESATLPFPDDGSATRACHFIVMTKPLTA
jgi:GNAT superfamily N-acetyltransferase